MSDLIKVLWIEDDPQVINAYPDEAFDYGLQLVHFPCWDAAKVELIRNYDSWEAIILDAKCKVHANDLDSAPRFLVNVLAELNGLKSEHDKIIPWYILSGGGDDEISPLISEQRLKWDSDWPKAFYGKTTDRLALFERIKNHCVERPQAIQVKSVLYKDVFEALHQCKLDPDADNCLTDLLCPLVFRDVDANDYNNRMVRCRKLLEYLFRDMIDREILPDTFREVNQSSGKDQVRLDWCQKMLAGRDVPTYSQAATLAPVLPKLMADNMATIINAVGSNEHGNTANNRNQMNMSRYREEVGETPFLLQSFALQFCDIILWYRDYVQTHTLTQFRENWEYL
jgi:hypothetical protein